VPAARSAMVDHATRAKPDNGSITPICEQLGKGHHAQHWLRPIEASLLLIDEATILQRWDLRNGVGAAADTTQSAA
jgi:hypothetical protein